MSHTTSAKKAAERAYLKAARKSKALHSAIGAMAYYSGNLSDRDEYKVISKMYRKAMIKTADAFKVMEVAQRNAENTGLGTDFGDAVRKTGEALMGVK